jgi:hypothetical protein
MQQITQAQEALVSKDYERTIRICRKQLNELPTTTLHNNDNNKNKQLIESHILSMLIQSLFEMNQTQDAITTIQSYYGKSKHAPFELQCELFQLLVFDGQLEEAGTLYTTMEQNCDTMNEAQRKQLDSMKLYLQDMKYSIKQTIQELQRDKQREEELMKWDMEKQTRYMEELYAESEPPPEDIEPSWTEEEYYNFDRQQHPVLQHTTTSSISPPKAVKPEHITTISTVQDNKSSIVNQVLHSYILTHQFIFGVLIGIIGMLLGILSVTLKR